MYYSGAVTHFYSDGVGKPKIENLNINKVKSPPMLAILTETFFLTAK